MNEVASLELSRELYAVSGWGDTADEYMELEKDILGNFDEPIIVAKDSPTAQHLTGRATPAYPLGYLIRKLALEEIACAVRYVPYSPEDSIDRLMREWHGGYIAYTPHMKHKDYLMGNIPEDAACKLAIELFKQGILTKEV